MNLAQQHGGLGTTAGGGCAYHIAAAVVATYISAIANMRTLATIVNRLWCSTANVAAAAT